MSEIDGIGVRVKYKFDGELFRRYTKNGSHYTLREDQFADDVALLGKTREGMKLVIRAYIVVANSFGVTVSLQKTKFWKRYRGRRHGTDGCGWWSHRVCGRLLLPLNNDCS